MCRCVRSHTMQSARDPLPAVEQPRVQRLQTIQRNVGTLRWQSLNPRLSSAERERVFCELHRDIPAATNLGRSSPSVVRSRPRRYLGSSTNEAPEDRPRGRHRTDRARSFSARASPVQSDRSRLNSAWTADRTFVPISLLLSGRSSHCLRVDTTNPQDVTVRVGSLWC